MSESVVSTPVPPVPHARSMPSGGGVRIGWRWVFATLLVIAILLMLWLVTLISLGAHDVGAVLGTRHAETTIIEVLRSEDLMFLVTSRIVTRVDVEVDEDSLLAGGRHAMLLATARVYVGIDLKGIAPGAIRTEPDAYVVTVPRPAILDVAVDNDYRYFDKKTGMWAISDWLNDRDVEAEMRGRLAQRARQFVVEQRLMPDEKAELGRLNHFAAFLEARVGKRVEFRYAP